MSRFFTPVFILSAVLLSSCSYAPTVQPQVNALVVAERFSNALKVLEEQKDGYGESNSLLYLLDKALVLHLAGQYEQSAEVFEQAKIEYDILYTRSISTISKSWLTNDYALPYTGEDFERVLINIFQALNFAAMGNIDEALVEARDVDSTLNAINAQYPVGQKNVYKDDAFARLLMGLLYEARGTGQGFNDAFISFEKAWQSYKNEYQPQYNLGVPKVLKQGLLRTSFVMGRAEYSRYQKLFKDLAPLRQPASGEPGVLVLVHYHGLSPLKLQSSFVLPLPGRYLGKLAFPRYHQRRTEDHPFNLEVRGKNGNKISVTTELGEDIEAIAIKNLADRKVRIISKAVSRSAGKYFAARAAEQQVSEQGGDTVGEVFNYGMNLNNVYSEQADLRSWQTLPAQIRIARISLDSGEYELFLNGKSIGSVLIEPGATRFFLTRTSR